VRRRKPRARARIVAALGLVMWATAGSADLDPAARPAMPTAETFAEIPFLSDPVLSPDGKSIAAQMISSGKTRVAVFDVDEANRTTHVFDVGDTAISDIAWAGSHRVLLTIGTTTSLFGIPFPTSRLYAVDVQTNAVRMLDRKSAGLFAGNILYTDPDGAWLLVASQDDMFASPSVKRIDLATGATTTVEKARRDLWDWYADGTGVVRAGIAYDGDRWKIWYRQQAGDPLVAIKGKHAQSDDPGAVDSLRFLSADNSGLIVTNARTGRFAAYRYDFATATIGDPVYENPDVDISSVLIDPISGVVSGIGYENERRRVMWIDSKMRALQARIEKALPGAEDDVVGQSSDGNRLLIWSGGAADPGSYYVFDQAAGRFNAIVQPYEKLAQVALAPVKAVHYATRDGLVIPAYLTLPLHRPAHGLPLIVMPHGGPFARDHWDYDPFVQFLASRGYAVLQPQFRGSTGYGRAFVEQGYGQWGRKMQDDLDDGMDWLVKSGQVDAGRVCIMGASYGGYAALWGAIRNPERYRCAISLAGVTDIDDILRYDRRSFSAPRYFRQWQKKVTGEDKVDLDTVSPLAQQARLTVPVLIAQGEQGEQDTNVPPRQGHLLVAALEKRHADVQSVFYKDAAHGFTKPEDMTDYLKRVEVFLAKYNPP
jgi:dipeptidyl aminopeptidase/acylaminoacyl peptidase